MRVIRVNRKSFSYMVIEGDSPSLLGREWLTHIQLDWPEISKVLSVIVKPDTKRSLKKLLHSYQEVFTDRVGVMKHHRAKLHLKEGAQPRYHRARPVPFAIRDEVAKELDRLEGMGILERVETSAWAAPIVVVPKGWAFETVWGVSYHQSAFED